MTMTLRSARKEDGDLLFAWRNHPDVRKHFFEPKEIPYAEHKAWFEASLQRADRVILIGYRADHPVGVIRFDFPDRGREKAEIDIYVAPERHGQGLGAELLNEGIRWLSEHTTAVTLIAKVKEENTASVRMFRKSGFESKYVLFEKEILR
jgi:RimJ/RimL family protein N-acetyltransferase